MQNIFYGSGLSCAGIVAALMAAGASEPLVGFVCVLGAALLVRSID